MFSLVLLLACSTVDHESTDVEPIDGAEAIPMKVAASDPGKLLIATAPDRSEPVRAKLVDRHVPDEAMIQRFDQCYGVYGEGAKQGYGGGGLGTRGAGKGGGGATGRAPTPSRTTTSTPSPSPKPAPPPAKGPSGGLLDGLFGGAADAPADQAPAAAPPPEAVARAEPATAAEAPMPEAEPMPSADATKDASRETRKREERADHADKKAKSDDLSKNLEALGYAEDAGDADRWAAADEEEAQEQVRPVLDWGATVYLSNDDSMSLASAQRLLYSMKRQVRPSVSEVRPHELLNYFSFDVAHIEDGRRFSVLGAAEQSGDKLAVSLAVRGANPPRKPLDLTVVVDRSGSMREEGRMDYLKRGLTKMAETLQDGDRVDIVLFDSSVCSPLENFVVGRDDPSVLQAAIDHMQPRGSTDLDAGLREAWRIQDAREAVPGTRNPRVMLITDANLNSGNVNEDLVSEVGRRLDENDVRLTGIGVGRNFNDTMLNKLTEKGKGAYVYLGSEAVVDRVFGSGFDSLTQTIAHDVQFSLELPASLAMERFYGEESSTNAADVQPIHYYANTTQLFLQDLAIKDGRAVLSDPIRMRIKYRDADTGEPSEEVLHTTVGALLDGDRHNLHKGHALMAFADVATAWAMQADPCGAPLQTYRQKVASLGDDAEIGYTNGLVGGLCGVDLSTVVEPGVAYKIKVDSDTPIAEVGLVCDGVRLSERLSGSDTVARFGSVIPGSCVVQLEGTVPMQARVEVPKTGGDVRCMVRGGRLSCG